MNEKYHIPVMLKESIEGLAIRPGGSYVDVTYGGGGHSRAILDKLGEGRLLVFDQDEDAFRNAINDPRLIFVQHNFKYLRHFLDYYKIDKVDGLLADLGVSSHDFDEASRGFSFRFDAPLDMRMNQNSDLTARNVVNDYTEEQIVEILREYGDVKNARKASARIVQQRAVKKIETTTQLVEALGDIVPKNTSSKYMARIFQALRIEVNHELDVLKNLLKDAAEVIRPGGRLVVISYHSLEDRLVKNFILKGSFDKEVEKDFFGNLKVQFKPVGKKLIVPGKDELEKNSRSRSAKLRVAERVV